MNCILPCIEKKINMRCGAFYRQESFSYSLRTPIAKKKPIEYIEKAGIREVRNSG
jgi:hypothetical protein